MDDADRRNAAETQAEGVRAWSVPSDTTMRARWVDAAAGDPPACVEDDDDHEWEAICRENERVHDGRIVRVVGFDPAAWRFELSEGAYRAFAVQERRLAARWARRTPSKPERFDAGLAWLLGVKGWIVGKDRMGAEHVLIARRGAQTRIYGLWWEAAPAGGIEVERSPGGAGEGRGGGPGWFDLRDRIVRTLRDEAGEELGIDVDTTGAVPVAVVQDGVARSFDVFAMVQLREAIDPRRTPVCFASWDRWEYVDAAWLGRAEAGAFAANGTVSPPTRAVMELMGWVDQRG